MKAYLQYHLHQAETSFRAFVKTYNASVPPLHYHPNYELNCVIKGNGTRYVGDNIEGFEEGDLILLAPNIPHRWKSMANSKQSYSSLVIQWETDFLGEAWRYTPEFKHIQRLLELSHKGVKFDKYTSKEIKNKQSDLLQLPPFEKLVLFLQLLNDLARGNEFKILCDKDLSFKNNIHNIRIDKIYQYIKGNYSEKITLAKMAGMVNMSEGAFSRFFSQTTKKPFFSFLNEYRIKMACKLLIETDMHIDEIGYSCGYDCLQFFYRQFARYKHCSPKTFRKSYLSDL